SAEPYPELSSYTPEKDDIGYLLRATVTYNDGQGDGKDKQSDPTATAVAVPSVPRDLTTAPDDGQMLLSWRAPSSDGESAITG
ncbi:MAG: hypothetical protein J4F35_08160, partial [Candidatus Latescibacteria bacterium]|nr:hypothetical protein [Candidatus Latescibacterota bacterium]